MLKMPAHGGQHTAIGAANVPCEGLTPLVRAQAEAAVLAIGRQVLAAPVPVREFAQIDIAINELSLPYENHVLKGDSDPALARHAVEPCWLHEKRSCYLWISRQLAPGIQ